MEIVKQKACAIYRIRTCFKSFCLVAFRLLKIRQEKKEKERNSIVRKKYSHIEKSTKNIDIEKDMNLKRNRIGRFLHQKHLADRCKIARVM